MMGEGLRPPIKWDPGPAGTAGFIHKIRAKKKSDAEDGEWRRFCGLVPVALFHIPSPGLSGLVEVREPTVPYGAGTGPDLEERISKEHLEPFFILNSGDEIRDSWDGRVDRFMDDHEEAGREVIERVGMKRIEVLMQPEKVAGMAGGFASEFESRWGGDLLDTFLFGLEIASRFGSSLAGKALASGFAAGSLESAVGLKLRRAVAGFDLGAWAVLSSLEKPVGARLVEDAAVELVIISKRSAAHAYGTLHRMTRRTGS